MIEGDGHGRFRLNPEAHVARVDCARLAEHSDPTVRKIAEGRLRRRAQRT